MTPSSAVPSSADQLAAAATHIRYRRAMAAAGDELERPDFWRALAPGLRITDAPLAAPAPAFVPPAALVEREAARLRTDGYLRVPGFLDAGETAPLRDAMLRLLDAGLPPAFVLLYNEVYQAFARAARTLEFVLGRRPVLLPKQCWAFAVPAGDAATTRWSAFAPHRDWIGGDPGVIQGAMPTVLSVWIPLTDVTTEHSCIYVLPASCDPHYRSADHEHDWDNVRLQDVRALPADAGSLLAWSTHLAHWGSRSSRFSSGPRLSITADLQRRDAAPAEPGVDLDAPYPFHERLARVRASLDAQVPG